jgi:hypothetical protein
MGMPILIFGKSGSGKSASLRNFKAEDVGIINVLGKPLPFKSDIETFKTDSYGKIKAVLKKTQKKAVVIDDAGYLITNMFMKGHSTKKGNAVFEFYSQLATNFWDLIEFIKSETSEDKIIYLVMHEDENENTNEVKPKTIGKMLNEKVCIEGEFTIVLRSQRTEKGYVFKTQSNGFDVAKTPIGLFEEEEIDNDLKMVDEKVREYYGL